MNTAASLRPASLRSLLAYARPYRPALLLGGALSILGAVAGLVQPLAARIVIDALGAGTSLATPLLLLGAVVVAGALIGRSASTSCSERRKRSSSAPGCGWLATSCG